MERPLRALREQLQKQDDELQQQIREQEAQLASLQRQREEIGVDLYGFQQQLAQAQQKLEGAHAECTELVQHRLQAEDDLHAVLGIYQVGVGWGARREGAWRDARAALHRRSTRDTLRSRRSGRLAHASPRGARLTGQCVVAPCSPVCRCRTGTRRWKR
jgi:hypothetical protein